MFATQTAALRLWTEVFVSMTRTNIACCEAVATFLWTTSPFSRPAMPRSAPAAAPVVRRDAHAGVAVSEPSPAAPPVQKAVAEAAPAAVRAEPAPAPLAVAPAPDVPAAAPKPGSRAGRTRRARATPRG